MRTVPVLAVSLALTALTPIIAHAQGATGLHVFARPFQYSDGDGPGTLTITPLSGASTASNFQRIRVTLEQNRFRFVGAGVYHYVPDAASVGPRLTLVHFTLIGANGCGYFFAGNIDSSGAVFKGDGTYFRVDAPQTSLTWQIQSSTQTQAQAILNNTPVLSGGWSRFPFSEAIGGAYFAADNTRTGATATATWSGTLPAGSYTVEVFVPARFAGDLVDRTGNAVYKITAVGPVEIHANQQHSSSGWVRLGDGSIGFDGSYRIELSNETGETPGTLRVVASAVRLTPVTRP